MFEKILVTTPVVNRIRAMRNRDGGTANDSSSREVMRLPLVIARSLAAIKLSTGQTARRIWRLTGRRVPYAPCRSRSGRDPYQQLGLQEEGSND